MGDFTAFFSIVFLQLGKGLDDGNHADAPGSARREQHLQGLYLWYGSNLIPKDHNPVREFPAMLICDGQHLPVNLLQEQTNHKIFCIVLLGILSKGAAPYRQRVQAHPGFTGSLAGKGKELVPAADAEIASGP